MIRGILSVSLLPVVLVLTACRSAPPQHYYVIAQSEVPSNVKSTAEDGCRLAIAPFRVDAPYDEDQLIYRIGRDSPEIVFYAHHRWAASLSEQLQLAASTTFRDLPGISSIGPLEVDRSYNAVLLGRLLYLEELDLPEEQVARVGIELTLLNRAGQQIWSQTVSARVGGLAADVPAIVRHMRRALQQAFSEARPGLSAAVAQCDRGS